MTKSKNTLRTHSHQPSQQVCKSEAEEMLPHSVLKSIGEYIYDEVSTGLVRMSNEWDDDNATLQRMHAFMESEPVTSALRDLSEIAPVLQSRTVDDSTPEEHRLTPLASYKLANLATQAYMAGRASVRSEQRQAKS